MNLTKKDKDLLLAVVKMRLATVDMLAAVLSTSEQMARRRSRKLAGAGLLEVETKNVTGIRGRPELIYRIGQAGLHSLKLTGKVDKRVPYELCNGDELMRMVSHQLYQNWVTHLASDLGDTTKSLQTRILSSTSPLDLDGAGKPRVRDQVLFKNGKSVPFIPDAVLCFSRSANPKGLLFFIEIDGGSEPLRSTKKGKGDHSIAKKLIVYRNYMIQGGYQRYSKDDFFGRKFRGFRLLLIAPNGKRLKSLCRIIREMSPLGFVWCIDIETIKVRGFWHSEWIVEGFTQNRQKLLQKG